MGSKQRIGNEVTDRAGFKLGFVPIFHFLRLSPCPFPLLSVLVTSVYCQSMELFFFFFYLSLGICCTRPIIFPHDGTAEFVMG